MRLAGALGRRPHVRDAEPDRAARRPGTRHRTGREAVRARHVPLPVGRRPPRRPSRSGFIGTDVYSRFKRMTGHNVLYTMGFDAFGLPAEQFAVQTGQHPRITTDENVATMRRQLRRLGLSHDPRRSVATTDPGYYRWTQWIFNQIFGAWYDTELDRARPIGELIDELESGARSTPDGRAWSDLSVAERRDVIDGQRLAFVGDAPVNWCPGLGTVVANEEVTADGRSDRGNFPVFKRNMRQWVMRITSYADRLIDDLDTLDWTDAIKTMQRNWIGRSPRRVGALRLPRRSDLGVHDPTRHVVRGDVHGAVARAPARRRADDVRPVVGGRRVPSGGDHQEGHRPPGRGSREDRDPDGDVGGQPGHRRRDPDLDRRLRADGLRHRGDHGVCRAATNATSSSPASTASTFPPSSSRPTPGSPSTASNRRSIRRAGRSPSSATRRTSTRRTSHST